jgi:D-alanyl-D-alanine carboxypeptidase
LHRTIYLAPLAFLGLVVVGFPGWVANLMDEASGRAVAPPPAQRAVVAGPIVSGGPLAPVAPTRDAAALASTAVAAVAKATAAAATPIAGTEVFAGLGPVDLVPFGPAPTPNARTIVAIAAPPSATFGAAWAATTTPAQPTPTRAHEPTATAPSTTPPPQRIGAEPAPRVGAREVIVVDGDSGAVLHEQNAHRRVAPASTTKIMTALVALARNDQRETVIASFDQSELVDSTLMGLRQGDRLSLEDLLYGLMLPSGNDAALAIANHVAGSKRAFVQLMNDRATELGLTDTRFANPHGLDAPGHYSSAHDMVQLARVGMRDQTFRALSAARSRVVRTGGRTYEIQNLNRVLGQVPGADGVKIGYTEDAGRTIVASAVRNGHRVYVAAFHSSDLVGDCRPLFEWAFRNFSWSARLDAA